MALKEHCDSCDRVNEGGEAWMKVTVQAYLGEEEALICSMKCLDKIIGKIIETAKLVYRE